MTGSISKQITAVLVLRAYDQGKLRLQDTLRRYLPDLKASWADSITVHQLLTHTHGITYLDQPLRNGLHSQRPDQMVVLENIEWDPNDLKKSFYYHLQILKILASSKGF
ncbi:MAG TPA: serine hydrolase domain-containing protein [Puia sp.]